jgi:hypothetical protein
VEQRLNVMQELDWLGKYNKQEPGFLAFVIRTELFWLAYRCF